ncbi:MAG: hypothetical protein JW388_1376 [Nitrospira sp.]|nr:hypothetical protein [Nitrospira sp.]
MMTTSATTNMVIGALAVLGLLVLIAVFVYVVKRLMRDE